MRERPVDLDEHQIQDTLTDWGVHAAVLAHVPLGFGDHHWSAADTSGRRWFLTLADLEHKAFLGDDPDTVLRHLGRAMDTAADLHDEGGLGFVVAPLRSTSGATVHRVGERYALSVFPYTEGTPGEFGQVLTPEQRARLLDTLARLHGRTPPRAVRATPPELAGGDRLAELVAEPEKTGDQGPFAELTAELLAEHGTVLLGRLEEFGRRSAEADTSHVVTTHGEPHPGNLLWREAGPLLVDWDTVGLAAPERDLWLVTEDPDELARYAEAAGHVPDPALLALYRLRWDLQDVVEFVDLFAAPHQRGADTEQAWRDLGTVLRRLGG
ncbi:phosphotransferase [Nocardiopsis ganjiahuensis]|uniref:phosphotransferase n=1 Tax=Nocardiopsis ganjiahuensis TaxID=239984 RepID=UPI00034BCD0E|nr:phosphotransferase [Nocardiopsis ganjiahuensis]